MKKKYLLFCISLIVSSSLFADTSFTVINNSSHEIWFNDVGSHVDLGRCFIRRSDHVGGTLIPPYQQSQFFLKLNESPGCRQFKGIMGFADRSIVNAGFSDYSRVYMNSSSDGQIKFNNAPNPNSNIKESGFTQQSITFVDW